MAEYGEDEHVEARSLAPAGGFGRKGSGVEHHMLKLKIEEVDTTCTGSSIDRHVLKETFEIDTVRHTVKAELEEVDTTVHIGGHHHHNYGHGVNTGGHHHHAHHGHDLVVRETRVEEDFNTHTGEFHKRKETFFARDD